MREMEWLGDKVDMIKIGVDEARACCVNCHYFYQHYSFDGQRYLALNCGHCVATQRNKDRNALAWCPMFENRD